MSSDNNIYFECECYSNEHTLKFSFDPEYDGELSVSTFLNQYHPWYKRVWFALKYIFGYKSRFGHFDSTLLSPMDRYRFYNLAKKFKEFHDNANKS